MFRRPLLILALAAAACTTVHAQSTPAKKEAIARILKVQQAGMDGLARDLLAEPAEKLLQQAGHAIARLPADKQEAAARDVQADARKFVDDNAALVRDRAIQLSPSTVGALLEEKFSAEELKQIADTLESPVFQRFQALGPQMQQVLVQKVVTDTRPQIEPKLHALEDRVAKRLGVPPANRAAPAANGKAPAKK
jgi:hypothetical protein